ncbi:MAG TPA: response regulator, partial [Opitutaceae bacterium]|nr:response regulator [Opitutaceae bacterium]
REFAAAVLQKYGYRVLQAGSGVDAIEVWKWHSSRISLLLTDLVMPEGMTGLELAEKLLIEKPDLKVICTSGYSGDMMERAFIQHESIRFMHKPYQPRMLASAVRDALNHNKIP